jgi:uncharacterized coiled-coil DUF342 family protein
MSTEWLGDLEARITEAAEELRRLRGENEELRAELIELRAHGENAPEREIAQWAAERDEVRARVARLVEQLEALRE